jgi:hypothetical protein
VKAFRLGADELINDYHNSAIELATALLNLGEPVGPLQLCCLILGGLPREFENASNSR